MLESHAFRITNLGLAIQHLTTSTGLQKESGESRRINVGSNTVIFIILHSFNMQSETLIIE